MAEKDSNNTATLLSLLNLQNKDVSSIVDIYAVSKQALDSYLLLRGEKAVYETITKITTNNIKLLMNERYTTF